MVEEVQRVRPRAEQAAHGEGVEWLGRTGLTAKGVSYLLVAVLAIGVAIGASARPEDQEGALHRIAGEAWGAPVLVALALGFAAYAIWCLVRALFDRDDEGDDAKGLAKRSAVLGKGAIYGSLSVVTVALLIGAGGASGKSEKQATATVLDWPGGRWIVGIVGLAIIGIGLANLYQAVTQKFEDDLEQHEMSETEERWYGRLGSIGHVARGVVFGLIGIFVVKAAYEYDPQEAIGLDGALAKLASQPAGPYLLGLTAAGLAAYGLFCFVQARYRRV
jgi:hypothetical protein